jgi:two-component system, OmpR family, sensor histidine kinase MtrB
VWRRALRNALVLWAVARRIWRRSLQLRMVVITLLLSGALVGMFGLLVASRITHGLVNARVNQAKIKVAADRDELSKDLRDMLGYSDPGMHDAIIAGLGKMITDAPNGTEVVLIGGGVTNYAWQLGTGTQDPDPGNKIPSALKAAVGAQHRIAHQKVMITYVRGAEPQLYLISGTPVELAWGGQFALYLLEPLDNEQQLVTLVYQTVLITGTALVLLLAVIAWLVTRLVVNPVRVAARTAQRLSAGLLDQRMEVRGEDDLALLGAAFNQMAANLQQQIVRLEDMSRLQRRFTSDVSHELRTPLTTVRMAADLIFSEREGFDRAVARSAELLQTELDRFEELLTDLLEISRFDAGFAVLDAEPTDLVSIVDRVVERLAPLAERAGVTIEVTMPDPPIVAEIDSRRVERVLRNLVGNAVEHAEGRPVRVALGADDAAVAVTVRDHGIGLRPGEEKLVFNRFWRADPSRARQTGGTGLGLSISLEDARLHGGWLEAWGAPTRGAQFRLTLPIRAGEPLSSSPLRLVPEDGYVTVPVQRAVTKATVAQQAAPQQAAPQQAAPQETPQQATQQQAAQQQEDVHA